MKLLVILGLAGAIVSLVLQIVGVATRYWVSMELTRSDLSILPQGLSSLLVGQEVHHGLFQACTGTTCKDISDTYLILAYPLDLRPLVITLEIVAILCGGATPLFTLAFMLLLLLSSVTRVIVTIVQILVFSSAATAGFLGLIGCIVYAAEVNDTTDFDRFDFDYSFILCIIAAILYLPATIVLTVGIIKLKAAAESGSTPPNRHVAGRVIQLSTVQQGQPMFSDLSTQPTSRG